MSSLRRVTSDSDSQADSGSEEEGARRKAKRKQPEPGSESELGSDTEGEETTDDTKQHKPSKLKEVVDEIESESESRQDPPPEPVRQPQSRSRNAKGTKARGPVKVPLVTHTVSGKRERDSNGVNGMKGGTQAEEPSSKKMKSPGKTQKDRKGTKAKGTKATGSAVVKPEKAVPSKVEKSQSTGRKRKASTPPPAAASAKQAQKVDGEKSPLKRQKPFSWSSAVEESLVNQLHQDFPGDLVVPSTKVDPYWDRLLKRLPVEEDLTGLQLYDKVRRMRQRYFTLRDRSKDDKTKDEGSKLFKSPHEERMYQLWIQIWQSAPKVPQPAVEVEHSDGGSAETAAATAPRENSKRGLMQSNGEEGKGAPYQSNQDALRGGRTQGRVEDSISGDENEGEIDLTQRALVKALPETAAVITPFISKPRLEFTPLCLKEAKHKSAKKLIGIDQQAEEVPLKEDEPPCDVLASADPHLKQFKEEMIGFFQDLRGSFFLGLEEQRNGSSAVPPGSVLQTGSAFVSGVLDGFGAGSGTPAARELQKKWRELKVQEIALLSLRLQLMQDHCRLQQEELKMQIQRIDE